MNVIEKIYGHPMQIQPAHTVITSPWYDIREIMISDTTDMHRHANNYKNAPIDEIITLKDQGLSYDKIANELELSSASIREWYLKAIGKFDGR